MRLESGLNLVWLQTPTLIKSTLVLAPPPIRLVNCNPPALSVHVI